MNITKTGTKLDANFKGECCFCGSEFEDVGTALKDKIAQETGTGRMAANVLCPHCNKPASMFPEA